MSFAQRTKDEKQIEQEPSQFKRRKTVVPKSRFENDEDQVEAMQYDFLPFEEEEPGEDEQSRRFTDLQQKWAAKDPEYQKQLTLKQTSSPLNLAQTLPPPTR